MRASRLLQILMLLQNRGRLTSVQLADELEVSPRTILRDLDALTEAGLPVLAHQGHGGGIELGFDYRTRLTGLSADEAEAMALILSRPMPELHTLGVASAARRARSKMLESFPDGVRAHVRDALERFRYAPVAEEGVQDPRVEAMARAVRSSQIVRLRLRSKAPQTVHPVGLIFRDDWLLEDVRTEAPIPRCDWGHINISAHTFEVPLPTVDRIGQRADDAARACSESRINLPTVLPDSMSRCAWATSSSA